jgi:hypothetical protein
MTEAELEAAHLAIIEVWQKSNNPVGSYFDCGAAARAALEAAEKARGQKLIPGHPTGFSTL